MSEWRQAIPKATDVKVTIEAEGWTDGLTQQMQNFIAALLRKESSIGGVDIDNQRIFALTTLMKDPSS